MSVSGEGDAAPLDVDAFLAPRGAGSDLRFIVCGSASDGKSTLLDRLLRDSKSVSDHRPPAPEAGSRTYGARGDAADPAPPADDPRPERERGFASGVGYRHFETGKRKFVAVDMPGNVRHTSNMAEAASIADLALILVDAREGVPTQTRRHSYIVSLMGIRHVVLAVDNMDLVEYERQAFSSIVEAYETFARELGIERVDAVPVSALTGENLFVSGGRTPWYDGPTLIEILESAEIGGSAGTGAFRLAVDPVDGPDSEFHGFGGTVLSGAVERAMPVAVSPSGRTSTVGRILGPSGDLEEAVAGQSITVVLADDTDVSRGDMLSETDRLPDLADQFAAHLIWIDTDPMVPARRYSARFAGGSAVAQITELAHRVDLDGLGGMAAKTLKSNEIGYCKISLDRAVPFDPYEDNRATGAFVLIDPLSDAAVGAGVVRFALRRASNVVWQELRVDKEARSRAMGQRPCILWFTGLSGAGKSTIADRVEQKLQSLGSHTYLLDGDNVRHGLNRDLGFTEEDRVENIRRIAEVARLMADAGLIVIVSFISPFRSEREMARGLAEEGEFVEIFVDTPVEVCEARDPKGLYAKARRGDLVNFTGIDSPYEPPENPELRIDTTNTSVDEAADRVLESLVSARRAGGWSRRRATGSPGIGRGTNMASESVFVSDRNPSALASPSTMTEGNG